MTTLQEPGQQIDLSPDQSHTSDVQRRIDDLLVDVMSVSERRQFRVLVVAWLLGLFVFSIWWFKSEHIDGLLKFSLNSLLILWTMVIPGYFFFFTSRMKRVQPGIRPPSGWNVAMVTTRAPSEPFSVVQTTLKAMLAQEYPHDTWLADEDPTEEIREWCKANGVKLSSRKGVEAYHQPQWPRRTKCKEGNLAYFYDHFGYEKYDFVAQLDSDHAPELGYLEKMLTPFIDPNVGYVSAPSICDANAQMSWAARGRLYSESSMHGALQAGYTNGYAPLCIGSHYAVRTKALNDIGGLGPELAEDHSTTLMMNSHGWRGIHALDAKAHGDGPSTLADCITQEFQWSRSLMVVLLTLLPKYWSQLPWRLRGQFLFSELWYLLFSSAMLCGFMLPIVAVLTRAPWVKVSYVDFIVHTLPLVLLTIAIVSHLRNVGCLRPKRVPILSWEAALFQLIRWPWLGYGCLCGIWTALAKRQVEFRVTPKGSASEVALPWGILRPYFVLIALSAAPMFIVRDAGEANGYFFFLILAQVFYLTSLFSIVLVHRHETIKATQ